jgi:hypothetical protein
MVAAIVVLLASLMMYAFAHPPQAQDVFTVIATPNELWPPNSKMVPIKLDVFCNWNNGACTPEHPCECCKNYLILDVDSHEPLSPDDYIIDNCSVPPRLFLKAERLGNGNGRDYVIKVAEKRNIRCTNPTAKVTVTVPHNK